MSTGAESTLSLSSGRKTNLKFHRRSLCNSITNKRSTTNEYTSITSDSHLLRLAGSNEGVYRSQTKVSDYLPDTGNNLRTKETITQCCCMQQVSAHVGVDYNERVDELRKQGSDKSSEILTVELADDCALITIMVESSTPKTFE